MDIKVLLIFCSVVFYLVMGLLQLAMGKVISTFSEKVSLWRQIVYTLFWPIYYFL